MEAVGWVMRSKSGDTHAVIAVTDRGHFVVRDPNFAYGRTWLVWESKDTQWDATWVTDQYEQGNYTLAVEPLQCPISDSFLWNPTDQWEEDAVEETMAPLLETLTAKLDIGLPKLVSHYGLSIDPGSPHIYSDGINRPAPAVTVAGKIRA